MITLPEDLRVLKRYNTKFKISPGLSFDDGKFYFNKQNFLNFTKSKYSAISPQ